MLANAQTGKKLLPTVVIATLVRNKAHTLPWFLGLIETLDYPKDRIALWIQSDHNVDNSTAILKEWLAAVSSSYHSVETKIDEKQRGYTDEASPLEWTEKRMSNVMKMRQKALDYARKIWADYIFMIDADVTLENNKTLQILMAQQRLVIGPMLNSSMEGYYTNFWGAMTEKGYYKRSENYKNIVDREDMGVFPVPMVHTAVLIDLHHWGSPYLSFVRPPKGYQSPRDDIIIFAHTVMAIGETMHVINTEYFGKLMVPLDKAVPLEYDHQQFDYVKLEAMVEEVPPLYSSPHVYVPMKPKDKLGFDQVYMINLKRRPARRFRMMKAFDYLGIDAKIIDAVDGKELNDTFLEENGIKMLPGFADPYHGRAMTMGEIGCFLSHYNIWKEMVDMNYEKIVVFEDDVRFEPYFRLKLANMMTEVEKLFEVWDLISSMETALPKFKCAKSWSKKSFCGGNSKVKGRMAAAVLPTRLGGFVGRPIPGVPYPLHWAMTMGEIGCFLSHYNIWKEMVDMNYEKIVVFEDDVRFEPYFRLKLANMMTEVEKLFEVWDLIYLGRKRLRIDLEEMVEGSSRLSWPHYSYWTVSYLLSNHGARKLLGQNPLSKMVPVDEYLPIMFNKHPEEEWLQQFSPRDLVGLSADPFLVYPTHYTGEPNYFSDTEDSKVISLDEDESPPEGQNKKQEREGGDTAEDLAPKYDKIKPEAALEMLEGARTKEELALYKEAEGEAGSKIDGKIMEWTGLKLGEALGGLEIVKDGDKWLPDRLWDPKDHSD
ncbi:glycosyltransferase 25 family member 1 [Plakobranchus ocellatus]|uniref:Glycosyltransferase 25 family member 1 n=1 Tax=Plakobranchus ocellatus TaxID=259542 RepID=A0AAV4BFW9_9GAST|nr:glycosyltransferase 25 family member 1 [Plakobranchus ocellatus]